MCTVQVDQYFTVQPHTLLRQHLDYSHWYDRNKLTLKDIHNTQYVSCMNPTAGSFTINTRLQRHFCVFALSFPGADALATIYNSILSQHMATNNFLVCIFLLTSSSLCRFSRSFCALTVFDSSCTHCHCWGIKRCLSARVIMIRLQHDCETIRPPPLM